MACLTPVTIRIDTPTGPLHSAVYEPGRDKIYAVRDGWVYQLNGSTGAKESAMRFAYPGLPSDTYIDYDSTTDRLWATYWRATADDDAFQNDYKFLVEIHPDTLVATAHDFRADVTPSIAFYGWFTGPAQIITRGGIGFILHKQSDTFGDRENIVRVDLATTTRTHDLPFGDGITWSCFHHDGTVIFAGGNDNDFVGTYNPANLAAVGTAASTSPRWPYGVTKDPTNGFAYIATSTQYVVRAEVDGALTTSEIDLGRADANPHNIRYNANDAKIYVPLYKDDRIAVIDPTDDSFEIKIGFTAPWDAIFTPTKAFALQHAAIGIKEIT